ncbi:hypothetical protein PAXINDRAFT_13406 [Paxillus involutus ATCC 200175]|uniref:Protein kinase domain-containing protein n=1 Tax=Paxillus involutus ATCC 200175 TaxID=664439 RepID=A0A0C9TUD2_PAXIN|nr:hypothetical protein PAXINDRAFT_13406 [Paxillus involutus ATCC 200175]
MHTIQLAQQEVVSSAERHSLEPLLAPPTTIDMGEGQDSHPSALVSENDVKSGTTRILNDIHSNSPTDLTGSVVREGQEPIASGSFGDTYKGTLRMHGRLINVAVKAIRIFNDGDNANAEKVSIPRFLPLSVLVQQVIQRVRREMRIWTNLDHINILPLLGTTMGFGRLPAMISPWLENGALSSYLERRGDSLTTMERLALLGDVAAGLHYLHSQSVVHGDLSGSNVLIDDNGRACICDFGLSTLLTELGGSTLETSIPRAGTLRWTAPELLELEVPEDKENPPRSVPTPKSDVYSFGRIMLQVLTLKIPYYYYTRDVGVLRAIIEGETPKRPSEDLVTDGQWAFMQRCWTSIDAREVRPRGEEIVEFVRHEVVATTTRDPNDIEGNDVEEKDGSEHPPAPSGPGDTYRGTHPQDSKDADEGKDVEEKERPPAPIGPGDIHRGTYPQGPKEGKNVEGKDGPPSKSSWNLNDIRSRFPTDLTGYVVLDGEHPFASGSIGDVAVKTVRTSSVNDGDDAKEKKKVSIVKFLPPSVLFQRAVQRYRRETKTWLNLDHINVLPLFGTTMGFGQFPATVCPWLENGSLTSYLGRRDDTLTKVERLTLVSDVAAGLQYLHSQFVVHGDLSGSNVLVDDNGRACISDFGLSRLLTELGGSTFATSHQGPGTLRWTAPELLGLQEPDEENPPGIVPTPQSDVYSFGMIMLQILTGKVPYHYFTREAQVLYIISQGRTPQRPNEDLLTDHQWAFMQRCWAPINTERPSGEEIVEFARHELVVTIASEFNDIEGKDVEEKAEDEHPPAPGDPGDTRTGTHQQGPKDESKDVEERDEGEDPPTPGSPEDTHRDTHSQGPKDDDEGKNVEEDELPSDSSWLRDILKASLPS